MHEPIFIPSKTESINDGKAHHISIRTDHPVLQEHFPGFPVVPGSMTVSMILDYAAAYFGCPVQLVQASFLRPIQSAAALTLTTKVRGRDLRFVLSDGTNDVFRGSVSAGSEAQNG